MSFNSKNTPYKVKTLFKNNVKQWKDFEINNNKQQAVVVTTKNTQSLFRTVFSRWSDSMRLTALAIVELHYNPCASQY